LKKRIKASSEINLVDIGCANGEFIYLCHENFPDMYFTGVDITDRFVEKARAMNLERAVFEVGDGFNIKNLQRFDVVTCLGTLGILDDPIPAIDNLLALLKKGGVLLVDGLFNRYNYNVYVEWSLEDSLKTSERYVGFHSFSYGKIEKFCRARSLDFDFIPWEIPISLPFDAEDPIRQFTIELPNRRYLLTNGLGIITNPSFLVIKA